MKLDQKAEAAVFSSTHLQDIAKAEALLLAAASEFLAVECSSLLAASTIRKAEHALSMKNPQAFLTVLRPEASTFIRAGVSGRFWELIDAIGLMEMATGCYWPYVTQADRHIRLGNVFDELSINWVCAA